MGERLKKIFRISVVFLSILCLGALLLSYLCPYVNPETVRLIPFFGLAYPIIILCSLILLFIWAVARSRWFFVMLAVILIGGRLHFRLYSPPFGKQTETSPKKIKLLSYNVKNFDVYAVDLEKNYVNRNGIFDYVGKQDADIICFQEFFFRDEKNDFPTKDTLHEILGVKHYHERMSFNRHYKNYFGVAMYSRYPMITRGFIELDQSTRNSNNFCIFADIVKNRDTFRVYNTHFQSIKFQEDDYALFGQQEYSGNVKSGAIAMMRKLHIAYQKRAEQALKVIEHMEQSPYDVIICGDFNDTPMSYVYNQFFSRFTDAFRNSSSGLGITYAGKVPAGRIDYIFHSKDIESGNFKIQKEVFSDHKAISCEFWKK